MLSFRDVSAWDEMVGLADEFPDHLRANVLVRQQTALALNRRNQPGDRDRARQTLEGLVQEKGADPETLGILGRVHKDRYRELKKANSIMLQRPSTMPSELTRRASKAIRATIIRESTRSRS